MGQIEQRLTEIRPVDISPEQLKIDTDVIVRLLGYQELEPPTFVLDAIKQEIESFPQYVKISAGYTIHPFKRLEDKAFLEIGGTAFQTQKIISAQMNRAEYAALFLCTIGDGLETRVKSLMNEGDTFTSCIIDFIASEAAERAVDALVEILKQEMGPLGLGVTYPFSPGYCGWAVAEQPKLFAFFPEEKPFGISLTPSNLMLPMKSVSGIVGIGTEAHQRVYPCKICTNKECYKNQS